MKRCLLLLLMGALLTGCTPYRHYDHYGVSVGEGMHGPDYHHGKVTWGSSLTKADIDEVNRMRAELDAHSHFQSKAQ